MARSPGIRLIPMALGALALLGLLAVDEPVVLYAKTVRSPSVLRELYSVSEAIGSPVGVLVLGWVIAQFDGSGESTTRVMFLGLGAGLLASGTRLFIGLLPLGHQPGVAPLAPLPQLAVAVGAALALISIFPQAWRILATLISLLAFSRLAETAHVSDVCAGALIGWLYAWTWLHASSLQTRLATVESIGAGLLLKARWVR